MKMPSTLTCICVFPPPHTLPHFLSLKKNKIKLVQRLQKKMENSKQLFWKEKKIKNIKEKSYWQNCPGRRLIPCIAGVLPQRGGGEIGIPVCGASHRTGKPSTPPFTPGALEKAGKKENYCICLHVGCTHDNCTHRFNPGIGIRQQIAVVFGDCNHFVGN